MRTLLVAIAVLTLIYGNLAALPQTNVKRLLAYSSIAHAGYLLVAVVSFSGRAVAFYLVAYLLMTLLSFAVLVLVSQRGGDQLESFAGLSQRSPFLAFDMLVAMASLAGVPFTAGFLGKFLVFDAAVSAQHFGLVVVAVITGASACGSVSCALHAGADCPCGCYTRCRSKPHSPMSLGRRGLAARRDPDSARSVRKHFRNTGRYSCPVRKRCAG